MERIHQQITGNNNIQVSGNYITTNKITNKTVVPHNSDLHISDAQAKEIKDKVYKIAESRAGERKFNSAPPYGLAYKDLYDKFKITSYKLLQKDEFDDAMKWLDKQIAIYRPKLKNVDEQQWRKDMYKSIFARSRQLGINIYEFASDVLELKKPLESLSELSDLRLKKLYSKVFSKR